VTENEGDEQGHDISILRPDGHAREHASGMAGPMYGPHSRPNREIDAGQPHCGISC
jgi:hypothetical protein